MKTIMETKTIEEIKGYEATDGTLFTDRDECAKYEKTCRYVIMSAYKKLVKGTICEYDLFANICGSEEFYYDLVKIENADDVDTVNKALKYFYTEAKQTDKSFIGKVIMVAKDYDYTLTGWFSTFDAIINDMRKAYETTLNPITED